MRTVRDTLKRVEEEIRRLEGIVSVQRSKVVAACQ
jgi:hypothetical protein